MRILSIETSCDETSVAALEGKGKEDNPSFIVISHITSSQASLHNLYGGVVPMLAKREHTRNLFPIFESVLNSLPDSWRTPRKPPETGYVHQSSLLLDHEKELQKQFLEKLPHIVPPDIDAIAVTYAWGLEPALWVGLNFAKALSVVWNIPFIPINHLEGHLFSVLWQSNNASPLPLRFPAIGLIVSGGDTELLRALNYGVYEIIGQTRDDAVGEAFDKVARLLSLPYPGGPEISKLAMQSRSLEEKIPEHLVFPRPMLHDSSFDFSYAGLKTAVLYKVQKLGEIDETTRRLIARSFEEAAIDVLIAKTKHALEVYIPKTLIIAGGVAANIYLHHQAEELVKEYPDLKLRISERELSTDNAVMIGIAGFLRSFKQKYQPYQGEELRAQGTLRLTS